MDQHAASETEAELTPSAWVTIVIPTFNRASFLATAIDSALAQDYPNVECLVVDDGSTDETPAVLSGYAGRITTVRQENRGVSGAINRGFEAASGEYVSVLNSDDELYPSAISATVAALESRPNASAAHGIVQLTTLSGEPLYRYSVGDQDLLDAVRFHASPSTTGMVYPRALVLRIGGWNPKYKCGSDYDLWLRLGLVGEYVFVHEVLGTFVQHPGSITTACDPRQSAREYIAVTEDFLARPDLPNWDASVAAAALRTAYYCAGVIVGRTVNQPGERFTINDEVAPRYADFESADS